VTFKIKLLAISFIVFAGLSLGAPEVYAAPTCTAALPDGTVIYDNTGTRPVTVYGVTETSTVFLPTWSEVNGQDDIVWYGATDLGGGTFEANIDLASHPGLGNIISHAYLLDYSNGTWVPCDSAYYVRQNPPPPPLPTCTAALPDGDTVIGSSGSRYTYMTGVSGDVTSAIFYAWSEVNGQDDIIAWPGQNEGGGQWSINISHASHPDNGTIYVHAYMFSANYPGGTYCDSANFVRVAPTPPTVDLLINGTNGPATVSYNGSATLTWSTTGSPNQCLLSPEVAPGGNVGTSGSRTPTSIQGDITYTITCSSAYGSAQDSVTAVVPAPTIDMLANGSQGPITIAYGTSATISWTSTNAGSCNVSGNGGLSGSFSTGALTTNTTYSGQCYGDGVGNDSVTVNVGAPPVPTCTAALPDGDTVMGPDGSRYTYMTGVSSDVTSVSFPTWTESGGQDDIVWYPGANEGGGRWSVNITLNNHTAIGNIFVHTYMYTPYHTGGTYCDSANFVRLQPELPTVDLRADGSNGPIAVSYASSVTLSWTTTGAPNQCLLNPEVGAGGNVGASGSRSTGPLNSAGSYQYSITCYNAYGNNSDSVTVNVNPPEAPRCTSAGPDGEWTIATTGTRATSAIGVAHATAVYFATFTDTQGPNSAIWHSGSNQGGGTWTMNIPHSSHPGIGNINVHVYTNNSHYSNVFCDTASFSRRASGTIEVTSRDASGNPMPTSWTLSCILTNPACPSYSSGANQTSGTYTLVPASNWTIVPAVIPGYTANVIQGTTQTLPNN